MRLAINTPDQRNCAQRSYSFVSEKFCYSAHLVCFWIASIIHHCTQSVSVVCIIHEIHKIACLLHVKVDAAFGTTRQQSIRHYLKLLIGGEVTPHSTLGLGYETHSPVCDRLPVIGAHQVRKLVLDGLQG